MTKIIIGLMIVIMSLFGNDNFSDDMMKLKTLNILNNKQKVFSVSEIIDYIFSIEKRGEFETKVEYNRRIKTVLNHDGIFYIFKKINTIEYDIDNKEMKFEIPLNYRLWEHKKPNNQLKNKGYTQIIYKLKFNSKDLHLNDKLKSNNDKYSYGNAYIKMDINKAKDIKHNKDNFYQIIAIKFSNTDISKKSISNSSGSVNGKPYFDLWAEVPCKVIGEAIVSIKQKEIIFAFGTNK